MDCIQCEGTISGGRCTRCGRQGNAGTAAGGGNAVTWPFQQPGLLANLWMPLAASFLWPFGIMIGLGWSVDAIGRRARGDSQPSPRTKDLAKVLKHGFVLMAMYTLFFVVPLTIIFKLIEFSWLSEVWKLIVAVWKAIFHMKQDPLWSTFLAFLGRMLTNALAPAIYLAVMSPLFLAARLRYAISGKVRSFFNLPANIMFCFRHVGEVLLYLFFGVVVKVASTTVLVALAPTVVGEAVPLLMGAANIWILAYLAGDLARVMREQDGVGASAIAALPAMQFPAEAPPLPAPAQQPAFYELAAPALNAVPAMQMMGTPNVPPRSLLPIHVPSPPAPPFPSPVMMSLLRHPQLYCSMGPLQDEVFPVVPSGYFIGRSPEVSQVIVHLHEVSSRHVRVEADPDTGGVWIEDMDSTNGTYYCLRSGPWQRLNGRVRLPNGGRFRLSNDAAEFEVREG